MMTLSGEVVVLDCYEVHRLWYYLLKNNHQSVMDFLREQFPLWESLFGLVQYQMRQMDLETTKKHSMNAFEYSVVSFFLHQWPNDMDYQTLIASLRQRDLAGMIFWEPFENYSKEYLAELMEERLVALKGSFKPKTT